MIHLTYLIILGPLLIFAMSLLFRRQVSHWRWMQTRREFCAHWGLIPVHCQQLSVALAWQLREWPYLSTKELQPLLEQVVDERWQSMERSGGGDLTVLRDDLAGLMHASTRGY